MNQYLDLALTWGIKIIGAIAIYIIGKWIAKLLTNLFRKMLERSNTDV